MKGKIKTSLLAGLFALLTISCSGKESSLPDIAKPYLGRYVCKQATLGSQSLLENFAEITLELTDEENFTLYYKEKERERKKVTGKYRYDEEREVLVLQSGEKRREFPLQKGKLTVHFSIGGKNCVLNFERE